MPLLLRNLRIELEEPEEALGRVISRRLRVSENDLRAYGVTGRSLDARDKEDLHFRYQVELALRGGVAEERRCARRLRPNEFAWIEPVALVEPTEGTDSLRQRPVVVGFGPAGMFAALRLAELGYKPIVLERGRTVRRRHRDILQRYYRFREFDPESNLLFGEGGAGTYSDGKLYTRVHDPLVPMILARLYQYGAAPDILIDARPHIGSDRLPRICWRIREAIERFGGEVRFEARLANVDIREGRLEAIDIASDTCAQTGRASGGGRQDGGAVPCENAAASCIAPSSGRERMEAGPVLLGIGHSARDTYHMLASRGVRLDARPFQIGVRIEHPQSLVDRWQYGGLAGNPRLGPAEYHLVAKGACGAAGDLFSFCMCPGGQILPTHESAGLVATNGASGSRRGGCFANSGLVITVDPQTMGMDALAGLRYQHEWERRAFLATGSTYRVPAQRAADFLAKRGSEGELVTSFPLGGAWTDLRAMLPGEVVTALERGLPMLDRRMRGFAGGDALITGPETRASAPVRITRDVETRMAIGVDGLYPIGEGAGYAGGIVSAAIDGWRSAEEIVRKYRRP
ncbi:MAG: hypothetical protein IT449_05465 [Phycisphaerales bacterium]|nr:hypothetical protein [Phycisphaerales bacterium]